MAVKNVKKRNWAMVVYPDSLPSDWLEQLRMTGLQCAISPLHDRDMNADGTPKKAHYHIIVCYSGPTSFNVVKQLTDMLNAPGPQPLEQIRGYFRYLSHKDNPEKAQYDERDILSVNGFNIADYVEMTHSEVLAIKRELLELIRKTNILEYSELMDLLQDSDMVVQFDVASSNTLFFKSYIASRRHRGCKYHDGQPDPSQG
uniref:Plasmid replication protein n=1 Tax=uncultured prokaryote TaxID=198431 RepID=A0A0H5Q743_9ZZZZ|nr:hypothetical protein [uncultured prokaryote]